MKFTIYGDNVVITEGMREKIETKLSFLKKYLLIDDNTTARVAAVDLAIDKLEDQIRRQKTRLSRRHKDSLAESFLVAEDVESEDDVPVRTKTIDAEEMTLDEAIMQMEMLGHSFFIYTDADSEKIAVVYKRHDGAYGLIEVDH